MAGSAHAPKVKGQLLRSFLRDGQPVGPQEGIQEVQERQCVAVPAATAILNSHSAHWAALPTTSCTATLVARWAASTTLMVWLCLVLKGGPLRHLGHACGPGLGGVMSMVAAAGVWRCRQASAHSTTGGGGPLGGGVYGWIWLCRGGLPGGCKYGWIWLCGGSCTFLHSCWL